MPDPTEPDRPPVPPTETIRRVQPPAPPAAVPRRDPPPTERFTAAPRAAARPQAPAEPPPGRRPWGKVALIGLAVAVAIATAIVVGTASTRRERLGTDTTEIDGVLTGTPDPKHPPQRDVALDRCTIERSGVTVGGTVRNPTDDSADYVMEVQLVDPDGAVITSGTATASDVAPGTRAEWTGQVAAVASNAPSATCKVVKVDRFRR